jgi:hypothetical protein
MTAAAGFDPPQPELVRRSIIWNGRQLDDVVAEAQQALVETNEPPILFVRAGQLVRLRADEDGRPIIETLRGDHVRMHLAHSASWWKALKAGEHIATSPPVDVCAGVLATHSWPLPALAGVVELPVLRPTGDFHLAHGYDPATRLFHWHSAGIAYPPISHSPSGPQLVEAAALVDEMLVDFPWETTADRANLWGLMLTPLVRAIVGQVPMCLVDAPEAGSGKSLLVQLVNRITTGRSGALMSWPATDEEMEKKVTAALMAGHTAVCFDNVEGMIRSPTLAAVLTTDTWSGRVLGRSEMVAVPNRATWMATGNNIDVGGDLARRCYRVRIDAKMAKPYERTGFTHPDLEDWVLVNRGRLLGALCTVVRSWWVAGRPQADTIAAMGSYTPWVRTMGGILHHAGVDGFLGNLSEFHATADLEASQWEGFLSMWSAEHGETGRTASDLIRSMTGDSMAAGELRDTLPDDLSGYWDTHSFSRRLGHALRKRIGRHYGPDGLHLVEMPRDRRNVATYSVTARSGSLLAPRTQPVPAPPPPPRPVDSEELF